MNLHRSGKRPDWLHRLPSDRNMWQQLAGLTYGLATPGNFFTLLGFVGVIAGLYAIAAHRPVAGLVLITAGRLCDLVDGWLAELTGTKSPLGELLDASADKIETVVAIIVLVFAGIIPSWMAIVLMILQTAIVIVVGWAKHRRKSLQPSKFGKLSMAFAWACLTVFVTVFVTDGPLKLLLTCLAYVFFGICLSLGGYALIRYKVIINS